MPVATRSTADTAHSNPQHRPCPRAKVKHVCSPFHRYQPLAATAYKKTAVYPPGFVRRGESLARIARLYALPVVRGRDAEFRAEKRDGRRNAWRMWCVWGVEAPGREVYPCPTVTSNFEDGVRSRQNKKPNSQQVPSHHSDLPVTVPHLEQAISNIPSVKAN